MAVVDHYDQFTSAVASARRLQTSANSAPVPIGPDERSFLYESVFLRAFRAYENLLEDVFICYMMGEPSLSGNVVNRFVSPASVEHARGMLIGAQSVLDWTKPEVVVLRAETFFDSGGPVKVAVAAGHSLITSARKIRNHISHNSAESRTQYIAVLRSLLLTVPMTIPKAGEFLSTTPRRGPANRLEILDYFVEQLTTIAEAVVEAP